jgi:hypothetical protein
MKLHSIVIARSPKGDEAVQQLVFAALDCFVPLAMTKSG